MPVTHTLVSALPDNAADAAAGLVVSSNWNDSHAIDSIEITGGTVTASTPLIDATQTWNNGAVAFTGWKLNVTNTASASGSLLADWQVGGASKFSIDKAGALIVLGGSVSAPSINLSGGGITSGFWNGGAYDIRLSHNGKLTHRFNNTVFRCYTSTETQGLAFSAQESVILFGPSEDVVIARDAAAVLAQRNGTNAQTFRVYGTYTDSSNYVRASLSSSSTAVTLAAETAGTGADNVPVNLTPAGTEGVVIGNFAQFTEMTAPAAGAANTARLFCEDNGAGKTRLMVQFASGAAQQIAIEP